MQKLYFNYEQFEHILKVISISKLQPPGRPEKVKFFFHVLTQALKIQFSQNVSDTKGLITRSNSNYSLSSKQDLNESNSSLDLSIKEALNTLKSDTKKQTINSGRVSISPRPAGRAYSNSTTPRSRTNRGFAVESSAKLKVSLMESSQSYKNIPRNKNKIGAELDEFLEAEKLAQKEVFNIKVNLKAREIKKPLDIRSTSSRHYDAYSNKTKTLEKARSLKIEGNYHTNEKVIDNKTTLLMNSIKNHRDFIIHTKQNHFSKQFVMSIVFNLWKAQCNKTTEKINNGEAN